MASTTGAVGSPPQDLTVRATRFATASPLDAGDVYVHDGDVTTTGDGEPGIATTSTGATTIVAGTVTTSGDQSDAITANGTGPISITATGVSTSGSGTERYAGTGGDGSYGIRAIGTSSIAINVGSVSTTGAWSTGVFAYSPTGDVTINTGAIEATGHGALGVYATGHDLTISTGSINAGTVGISAYAVGSGASVDLTVNGDIYAKDKLATGIAVASDGDVSIHDSGSVTAYSTQTGFSRLGGGGGILVQAEGNITIDGGTNVSAYATGARGVSATSQNGNISLTLGDVKTTGDEGDGIFASTVHQAYNYDTQSYGAVAGGDVSIVVGNVSTGNQLAPGILAAGANVSITLNGDLSTAGPVSGGIIALAYAGNATIHNKGSVSTSYVDSTGIYAKATGDVTIDGGGSISVTGINSGGIVALTQGGAISIAAGDISSTVGAIYAVSTPGDTLGDPTKAITISGGDLTTTASGKAATGIIAYNGDYQAAISIKTGSVTTRGDYATGILAQARNGAVTIDTGDVTTRGINAGGIIALGGSVDITTGTVSTSGDGSLGIEGFGTGLQDGATPGHVTITGDKVATQGVDAFGVAGVAYTGNLSINVGTVITQGKNSVGIYAQNVGETTSGSTDVTTNMLTTAGDDADGIIARSLGGATSHVTVNATTVSTSGLHSAGIAAIAAYSQVSVISGAVTTSGDQSTGIIAYSQYGTATVKAGTVTTAGLSAQGIYTNGGSGAIVSAQNVTTSGYVANGVVVRSGGYGLSGDESITIGTVATHGKQSGGIDALVQGVGPTGTSSLTINAGTVTTDGLDSPGITAFDNYGAIGVTVGSITTKGAESTGIIAIGGDAVSIQTGAISTLATAIYARSENAGALSVGVTGKVASSGYTAIHTINAAGTSVISVGAGGSIVGANDGIAIESGGGAVSVTNAGTIAGGVGYAIDVSGIQNTIVTSPASADALVRKLSSVTTVTGNPSTTITNSGTIIGAVRLSGGDDTLTNSGIFIATKDSDFGAGNDLFVNSGRLLVQPSTKPGAVTLLGLERFQNSGLVDLRNGIVGDTLTLTGSYVGAGGAMLGLDVGANGVADKLVIGGAATGTTSIVLNATAANATLIAKPVTLVQAGTGTAATAFNIANQDVGFVSYGLAFNAASNSFQLSSTAGSAVHRLTKLNEGAQAIWHQSADAWSSHMAELRDANEPSSRIWGQAYGQTDTSHDHGDGYNLGYRQDYYGGQAGVDLGGKRSEDGNGLLFGVTGGYLSSHLNLAGGPERVRYDTLNAGGYATFRAGPLFVNLLGQYDHYRTDAGNSVEHWTDKFSGNAYGAQAEVGARLGSDAFFAEPIATIAWQRTDLGTLQALGQSLDLGHDTGLTGTIGGRFGSTFDLGAGSKAVLYAKAAYVHEFRGKGGVLFESGGTSEDVTGSRIGDYGKAAIGVNIVTTGRMSGFIEGDGDVGGSLKGGGGRVGISFKL